MALKTKIIVGMTALTLATGFAGCRSEREKAQIELNTAKDKAAAIVEAIRYDSLQFVRKREDANRALAKQRGRIAKFEVYLQKSDSIMNE